MTERMSTFFPSEFTGIAQWIICTIYILSNEKGIRGWKAVALILFALPILVLMNIAHSEQPALIWLVITVCCLASVLIYLRLGIREDFSLILLRWCNAVMQSEFAAALAYVINTVNEQIVKTAQGTSKKENCSVTNHNLSRFL